MGIFNALMGGGSTDPAEWIQSVVSGQKTKSGTKVNEVSSLSTPAVFACVRVLSESLAQAPLHMYENLGNGEKRTAREHHLYEVLHLRPNHEMSAFTLKETLMMHVTLWGNAYAEIEYNDYGEPIALWPLMPNETWKYRDPQTGDLKYQTIIPHGKDNRKPVLLPSYRVLHIQGISLNGLTGLSVIRAHAESIGMAKAGQEFGAHFFSNGLNVGSVVEHPGQLSEQAYNRLRQDLEEKHQGLSKANRMMLLEEGMKYTNVGIPPEDAQFLETRKYQNSEIARIFRVPPHMIQDLEKATFSNIEHQSIDFWKYTMMPWFNRWEQSINNQLLFGEYRRQYYAEFDANALMRGDAAARANYYSTMWNIGAYSTNEIRKKENENPIGPEGDEHIIPMNMMALSDVKGNAEEPDEVIAIEDERFQLMTESRHMPPEKRAKYEWQIRSATSRKKIKEEYKGRFESAAQRAVNKEVQELKKQLTDNRSAETIDQWVSDFYKNQMPDILREELGSQFNGLADKIRKAAEEEVGAKATDEELEQFKEKYMASFISRYTGSSKGQIRQILNGPPEDVEDALAERAEEWQDKRAGKVSMNETVQLGSAVAKVTFAAVGIAMIRWMGFGSKTCPLCSQLDGTVVGAESNFVPKNGSVAGANFERSTGHPPLHEGCECEIVAD